MIDLEPDRRLTEAQAETLLGAWLAVPTACSAITAIDGGMVNSVFRLEFDQAPHRAVVKIHGAGSDTFTSEARGLEYLRTVTACPVPRVYAHDSSARLVPHAFLLVEDVPGVCLAAANLTPVERAGIEVELASVLGELHGHRSARWGSVETGGDAPHWGDLFARRLGEARAHVEASRRLSDDLLVRVDASIRLARRALGDAGRPTLVHGDVWDGNLMVDRREGRWGLAALLDPDLQFADVELELAYLEVFGAHREKFFDAYADLHPRRPGYEERRLFYWLHTALVHVALFGDQFFCDYTAQVLDQIDHHWGG